MMFPYLKFNVSEGYESMWVFAKAFKGWVVSINTRTDYLEGEIGPSDDEGVWLHTKEGFIKAYVEWDTVLFIQIL